MISSQADIISSTMGMDHFDFTPPEDINENIEISKLEFTDESKGLEESEFVIKETQGREWLIRIVPYEGDGSKNWFEYEEIETTKFPKKITIKWDMSHPYSKKVFKVNEDSSIYKVISPEIFKLISYLVLGEIKLGDLNRKEVGIAYYRDFINKALRMSSEQKT